MASNFGNLQGLTKLALTQDHQAGLALLDKGLLDTKALSKLVKKPGALTKLAKLAQIL